MVHCLLELFQQPFHIIMISLELKEKIKNICLSENKEICGFIVFDSCAYRFIKVDNKHPDCNSYFLVSPLDYLNIKNKYTIKYLFHSHNNFGGFSNTDLYYQQFHNLDMLIYDKSSDLWLEMKCK